MLAARARSARGPYRDRLRASIVLAAAVGQANATIAAQMGVCTDTVRKWRRRFAEGVSRAKTHSRPLTWHFALAMLLCGIR